MGQISSYLTPAYGNQSSAASSSSSSSSTSSSSNKQASEPISSGWTLLPLDPAAYAPRTSSTAGDAARARASAHAKARGAYFEQSRVAYTSGDGAAAKALSEKGKAEGRLMEKANAEAAAAYFAENNAKLDLTAIDLHGLFVEEAIQKLEERISALRSKNMPTLVVIVGRGNHSKDGVGKIKPAVHKLMAQHRLKVMLNSPNDGCLTILLDSKDESGFFNGLGRAMPTPACLQQ